MAAIPRVWTLETLHALPDDGNKYELVRGELFVTPAPSFNHETIGVRLARILDRYVGAHGLGYVYRPRAVLRFEGSEVEPDLMVLPETPHGTDWDDAPRPLLVVEIMSPSTHRRDHVQKRQLYEDAGVPEYWIVDPETRAITIVRPGKPDITAHDAVRWHPEGAAEPLAFPLEGVFGGR